MKKNFGIILAIAMGLSALLLTIAFQAGWVKANPFKQEERAGTPPIVSYQGQLWDGIAPYDGDGYFMFALIDEEGDIIWSNDGTRPPETSIPLPVTNGLFSINLGDTSIPGMDSRLSSADFDEPIRLLRVWFSPNDKNWTQMPDQVIASVPYALQADMSVYSDVSSYAYNADTVDGIHGSAFQLRVNGSCPIGQAVRSINTNGTVNCESIPDISKFTLKTVDSLGSTGLETSIAIGTDGLPLITYRGPNNNLFVAHCNDIYCTDATISTLVSGVMAYTPDIAIGSDGFGIITYHDNTNGDLKVVHCTNAACTTFGLATLDTNGDVGYYNSIAIGTDGLPLIAYYDETNKDLRTIHCSNVACSSISGFGLIDSGGDVGRTNSLVIGTDNLGLISYYDVTNTSLKVFHCTNQHCTSGIAYTIDNSAIVGQFSSIAIGTDGKGLISYYDNQNQDLKVAHCYNMECSTAFASTLDSDHDVGGFSSIVIGRDGLGIISYWDTFNGYLKSAHCDGLLCSTATLSVLDGRGHVGWYTSIAIGVDGMPVISYTDNTKYDLKVAHCGNELCIPINWEP